MAPEKNCLDCNSRHSNSGKAQNTNLTRNVVSQLDTPPTTKESTPNQPGYPNKL